MNSLTLPWRNFVGRPIRSALTVTGVAIAIANFVAMIGISQGIPESVANSLRENGADLIVSSRGAFSLLGVSMPESLGLQIARLPDVAEAAPVLFNIITADDQTNIPVAGWGDDSFLWRRIRLIDGTLPNTAGPDTILLGDVAAAALNKKVGDSLELDYRSFKIVGIAKFDSVLNQNLAVTTLGTLQQLLGRKDSVSFIQVVLREPLNIERLERARSAIAAIAPEYSVQDAGDLGRNLRLLQLLIAAASSISLVALVMAILGVANSLFMSVNERIGEIGILRAVGWTSGRILVTILIEGILISTIGGVVGIALGVIDARLVAKLPISFGFIDPKLTSTVLLQALALAIFVGAFGAIVPARRAIRFSPAEALRRI